MLSAFSVAALLWALVLGSTSTGEESRGAGIRGGGGSASTSQPGVERVPEVVAGTVKKGETASSLLAEWLTPQEIQMLDCQSKSVFSLRKIREGQPYVIRTLEGKFHSFEYEIDREERLVIRPKADGFGAVREAIAYQVETAVVSGTITTSLYEAARQAGEEPELTMKLAEIFGWDVDFAFDIRAGDTFKVILEKRYRDGEFAGYGRVMAAELVNRGRLYQGFLFEQKDGSPEYYDAQGRSLRRAFLKTPLDYTYISSGFSWNRFHPIKKHWCPHPAIDYAAPVGTPVRTVGDGVVARMGRNGSNGKYLKIRHNSIYETDYLHLSHFARGIKKGRRVRQGQVIGYVGNTGMSTGPHLDFRMRKNGRYVNPRKVIAPASPPVSRERIEAFRDTARPLLARLEATEIPVAIETSLAAPPSSTDRRSRGSGDASAEPAIGGF